MNLIDFGKTSLPTSIQDPFIKAGITDITVCVRKSTFSGEFYAYGTIEFKNDKTEGKHRIEGKSFDDVVIKMKALLETLK